MISDRNLSSLKSLAILAVVASSVGFGLLGAGVARADSPVNMAPPIGAADQTAADSEQSSVDQTTVFNWTQVPKKQNVDIKRATFDKGGYQLYDTAGDTIIVPFTNHNLYVMKFARSDDDEMYFVNSGSDPVLYVPDGGYLENSTVAGARWYPINDNFHPSDPVYMGIAPSWDDYVFMGWYPGMVCDGGYYSDVAFGDFAPCPGFVFDIGGDFLYGWNGFYDYCVDFAPPFRTGFFFDRGFYGRGFGFGNHFPGHVPHLAGGWGRFNGGEGRGFFGGGSHFRGADGAFSGASHNFGGRGDFAGRSDGFERSSSFRGGSFGGSFHGDGGQSFSSNRSFGGSFGGGRSFDSGGRSFSSGRSFGGSFGGGGRGGRR